MQDETSLENLTVSGDDYDTAREMHGLVTRIPDVVRAGDRAARMTPMKYSPLAADDRLTDVSPTSHYLSLLFQHAADFLRAIEKLCDPHEESLSIPLVALNPLMRGVLEDSAIALWLLQPDDPKERTRRMLVIRDDELGHEVRSVKDFVERSRGNGKHLKGTLDKLLSDSASMRKRTRAELRKMAAAVGLDDADYVDRFPAWVTLIDEAKVGTRWENSAVLTAVWSTLSGMSHFSRSKAMSMFDHEVFGEPRADGVRHARVTANLGTTVHYLVNTIALYSAAAERVHDRKLAAREV